MKGPKALGGISVNTSNISNINKGLLPNHTHACVCVCVCEREERERERERERFCLLNDPHMYIYIYIYIKECNPTICRKTDNNDPRGRNDLLTGSTL